MPNYLIEQLDNTINVVNADNDQLLGSFGLDAKIQAKYSDIEYLYFFADDVPSLTMRFTDSVISTKDNGGAAVVFVGTLTELVNKINTEYFTGYVGGSSGGGALQTTFDEKYTGYTINLENPDVESFNGFPFALNEISIETGVSANSIVVSNFTNNPTINRIEDLIELLNISQPYYYFVKVSATVLGIQSSDFPTSLFSNLLIADDTNGVVIEYQTLLYVTSAIAYSTQDLILQELRYSNYRINDGVGRFSETLTTVNFSAINGQIAIASPFRKTVTIANTSTSDLFLQVGGIASLTSYKYRLPQNGIAIIDDNTNAINGIWDTGVADGTALVNITY